MYLIYLISRFVIIIWHTFVLYNRVLSPRITYVILYFFFFLIEQFSPYTITRGDSLLQVQWSTLYEGTAWSADSRFLPFRNMKCIWAVTRSSLISDIIVLNRPEAISAPICNLVNTSEPAPNTTAPSLRQKLASTSARVSLLSFRCESYRCTLSAIREEIS